MLFCRKWSQQQQQSVYTPANKKPRTSQSKNSGRTSGQDKTAGKKGSYTPRLPKKGKKGK